MSTETPDDLAPRDSELLDDGVPPIIDTQNPFGFADVIDGKAWKDALLRIPENVWEMDDSELEEAVKPTHTDWALKVSLWREITKKNAPGAVPGPIPASAVYGGICRYRHWYYRVLANEHRMAWLLSPTQNYLAGLDALLYLGRKKYREIIEAPILTGGGKLDVGAARLVFQVMQHMEERRYGAPVKRNLNANVPPRKLGQGAAAPEEQPEVEESPAELRQRYDRLEAELRQLREDHDRAQHLPILDAQARPVDAAEPADD